MDYQINTLQTRHGNIHEALGKTVSFLLEGHPAHYDYILLMVKKNIH